MKKALFIDRDGTLVIEPPVDYQLDSFHKLEFYPKVFRNLGFIRSKLDFEFVMVTNQDGLGTSSFPEDTFWPVHNLVLKTLEGEGIIFDDILIDRSFPEDHVSTRKPGTGMMGKYLTGDYDLANSFVIGDRVTDVELAKNMGCKAILLQDNMDILKEKEQAVVNADLEHAKEAQARQNEAEAELEKLRRKADRRNRRKALTVGEAAVADIVSDWTKIPVQRLTEGESRRLANLEKVLKKRVIGQDEAVSAVARAVKRGRVGLKDPARPIGSFLFLGPTGVGKTELSKALAEAVFGSEQAMIRVDMSEYMEGHSVSKMIGSPPGYVGFEEGGQLSEKVRRNPYSVVLFDEIEKAHPDVFNVLLQVLDDGHITDSKGRKVSFKNTVLIMTSNAGAQRIVDPKNLGFATEKSETKDYEKMKAGVMEEVKHSFKPEFINRIDDIIVFHQLNNENMKEIVNLLAANLYKRCENQLGIHLTITAALKEHLVSKYADNKMGARPLKRAIQSVVEDALAEEILQKKVVPGDKVSAGFKEGKVVFTVKNK